MFNTIWRHIKGQFHQPYFPFLLAWFPVMGYYLHNLAEADSSMLIQPLAIVTIITCLVFLAARWLVKDWGKAGIIAGVIAYVVFSYNQLASWYPFDEASVAGFRLTSQRVLIPLSLVLVAGLIWWLRRSDIKVGRFVPILNVLALVLVAQLAYSFAISEFNRGLGSNPALAETMPEAAVAQKISNLGYNPDVYYIVLDRYPNQHTLTEMYDADNSEFLKTLADKGFYVADKAAANYPYTPLSLSSSLNMQHHQAVDKDTHPYPQVVTRIYPELQDTAVNKLFHQLGYKTYQMGSWFTPTHENRAVDENFMAANFWHTQAFANQYLSGTMIAPLARMAKIDSAKSLNYDDLHLRNFEYQREHFADVAKLPGPKFVFVHMLMPHPPYVVDESCTVPANKEQKDLAKFIDQTKCASEVATEMIDTIMKSSKDEPIILLQSDEGPYTYVHKMKDSVEFEGASDESVLERSRILNAFYLPDGNTGQLYDTISPVNSFRVLFRQYFGADLENLPDDTFVPPSRPKLFSFIDVTDVIRRWQNTASSSSQ